MELLKFNEDGYNTHVSTIQKTLTILKDTAKELEKHGVQATPKSLTDGKVYKRALEHYRKKYESSTLSKDISFEKYLEFTETDISSLKLAQQRIEDQLGVVFKFYSEQHMFHSFFEHRPEPELHSKAPERIKLPITKLFKWIGKDEIEVTLDKKYFELYTTSSKQVEKIAAIDNLILACKEMDVEHELVRKATSRWVNNLSYDLSKYDLNYFEILKTVN